MVSKTISRKTLVLAFVILAITVFFAPISAWADEGSVKRITTSNYADDSITVSVEQDILSITGRFSDREKTWIFVSIEDDLIEEEHQIKPGRVFSVDIDLAQLNRYNYTSLEVYTGTDDSRYWTHLVQYHLTKSSGGWRIVVNEEILKNNADYSLLQVVHPHDMIDNVSTDIKELSDSITQDARSDYEKCLLIHDWVCENIYYDEDVAESRSERGEETAEETLAFRRGVCAGYSNLTKALLNAQNIPCMYVRGLAFDSNTLDELTVGSEGQAEPYFHAWNEAFVENRWILMDTTWDSNNTYSNGQYQYGGIDDHNYFDPTLRFFSLSHQITSKTLHWNGFIYNVDINTKTATITGWNEKNNSTAAIHIPDTIGIYPVTAVGDYAFYQCYSIASVSFSSGISSIGKYAFAYCPNLRTALIPDGINVSADAFYGSTNIVMSRSSRTDTSSQTTPQERAYTITNTVEAVDIIYATATPGSAMFKVNRIRLLFEAYNIDGYNYVKLRDIAFATKGTQKQFDVHWDEARRTISINRGGSYTRIGGELDSLGDGTVKPCQSATITLLIDGRTANLSAYTINGNNYFKLRDLASIFDFGVAWDDVSNTVNISTDSSYQY